MTEPHIRKVKKAWGVELWLLNHPGPNGYCCKKLIVEPGWICSMHRHHLKNESFIILSGRGYIELEGGPPIAVGEGHIIEVSAGRFHRFWSTSGMTILEISSFHDDADVERTTRSEKLPTGLRSLEADEEIDL